MLTAFIKIFSLQTPFTGQNGEVSQRGGKKKRQILKVFFNWDSRWHP